MSRSMKLRCQDPEYRARQIATNRQIMQNPETRRKCHNQGSFVEGHEVSTETRARISERTRLAMASPEIKAKVTEASKARRGKSMPEHSDYMKQRWQDPEFRDNQIRKWNAAREVKPNQTEQKLISLFQEHSLPFRYVGNGEVIMNGCCPDFINTNGKKQLIELFGEYWHPISDEAKRSEHFRRYGFTTLVIWDSELKDEARVIAKVKEFVEKSGG